MKKVLYCVALLLLTVFIASCSDIDFKERLSAKYASPNTYVVSGYDVDQETPGYDSLSIPDLDLKIFAERKIMPELSNDLYSTVIYLGQNGIINRNYGFFVGDSTRKPCLFQIKDDTIITELLDNFKAGPIRDFCLNKNGQFGFTPKRSENIKQRCIFSNWTYDLSLLTTDWTAKNDITVTGSTVYRIMIADGVTITLNNVAVYNSFTCNGNATVVLAPGSNNLVRVSKDYTNGFVNGGQGTTLTIEGSGELTSDMSEDRDRAGIGGNNGDIIIKGGTITALGGHGGAGIGASRTGTTGKISIIGGNITAVGGKYAAGIGTGDYWWYDDGDISSRCGDIVITGGAVVARGGVEGAGIGSGRLSDCGKITISCSVDSVIAYKGYNADNSIGAGSDGTCEDIIIEEGAKVYKY